jgi:hypothetical protein
MKIKISVGEKVFSPSPSSIFINFKPEMFPRLRSEINKKEWRGSGRKHFFLPDLT